MIFIFLNCIESKEVWHVLAKKCFTLGSHHLQQRGSLQKYFGSQFVTLSLFHFATLLFGVFATLSVLYWFLSFLVCHFAIRFLCHFATTLLCYFATYFATLLFGLFASFRFLSHSLVFDTLSVLNYQTIFLLHTLYVGITWVIL